MPMDANGGIFLTGAHSGRGWGGKGKRLENELGIRLTLCIAGAALLVLWPERKESSWNLFCLHLLHDFGI